VIYAIGQPLHAFGKEGDEGIPSPQGELFLGRKDFPGDLVCPGVLGGFDALSRAQLRLQQHAQL